MEEPSVSESMTAVPSTANNSVINTAITTMVNNGVSLPDNVGLEVQSTQDFRSAASELDQSEQKRDAVFSETPQTQLHVANGSQTVPQNALQSSREGKSLGSVNNTGRKNPWQSQKAVDRNARP